MGEQVEGRGRYIDVAVALEALQVLQERGGQREQALAPRLLGHVHLAGDQDLRGKKNVSAGVSAGEVMEARQRTLASCSSSAIRRVCSLASSSRKKPLI